MAFYYFAVVVATVFLCRSLFRQWHVLLVDDVRSRFTQSVHKMVNECVSIASSIFLFVWLWVSVFYAYIVWHEMKSISAKIRFIYLFACQLMLHYTSVHVHRMRWAHIRWRRERLDKKHFRINGSVCCNPKSMLNTRYRKLIHSFDLRSSKFHENLHVTRRDRICDSESKLSAACLTTMVWKWIEILQQSICNDIGTKNINDAKIIIYTPAQHAALK